MKPKSIHEKAMERLNALNISTTLVVTIRRGANDDQLGELIDYAVKQPCVRGVTFQSVQAAGRLEKYDDGYQCERDRLTLTEVRRNILQQSDLFQPEDIIPVPCHADSIAMAYALKLEGQFIPLTGLIDPQALIEGGRNTMSYEKEAGLQRQIFELFSTHHNPASQSEAARQLLAQTNPIQNKAMQNWQNLGYQNIFRIVIMEFIDA
jgi:uncharacterized radical SAM superfamily Fe-S cluster-containing enzyme